VRSRDNDPFLAVEVTTARGTARVLLLSLFVMG